MSHALKSLTVKSFTMIAGMLLMTTTGQVFGQAPCPHGSEDRAFEMDRDLQSCEFGDAEGSVGTRLGRFYNVYCPGRMSRHQAVNVAKALVRNTPPVDGNPIPADFDAFGLEPRYAFSTAEVGHDGDDVRGIPHWFQYSCGRNGVATHIKIHLIPRRVSSVDVAEHCSAVNRAGVIRNDGRVDVEYRCAIHLVPSDREDRRGVADCPTCTPPLVSSVASLLVREEIQPDAQERGLQSCLLDSTDIQCAPCSSSDKLVAKLTFVERGESCPRGSRFVPTVASSDTESSGDELTERQPETQTPLLHIPVLQPGQWTGRPAASGACAEQVQDRIAWDYKGSKRWAASNLTRLCRGAESSSAPAACFNRVMHGGIDWGNGTRWAWSNAIDLCEGARDADRTIACFEEQISTGHSWQAAIRTCGQ